MNIRGFISKAKAAARKLAAILRPPLPIGFPLGIHVSADPTLHALDFAQ
jgi:hypothetical protein